MKALFRSILGLGLCCSLAFGLSPAVESIIHVNTMVAPNCNDNTVPDGANATFCPAFESAVACGCAKHFSSPSCPIRTQSGSVDMTKLYQLLLLTGGGNLSNACHINHPNDPQTCITEWTHYMNGETIKGQAYPAC